MTFASFVRGVNSFGFTRSELRTLRALKTPAGVQRFLDGLPYNLSYTARSPQKVLRDRTASCLEGGIFGAAALRVLGFPPLIFDLEADQDTDHVVAIFKVRGRWGAVAKSNRKTDLVHRRTSLRNPAHLAAHAGDGKTPHPPRSAHHPRRNARAQKEVAEDCYRSAVLDRLPT
jgi:hypothetical protein